MAIEIKVPRLGWSMEEGTFIEWLKREGQPVQAGEPLFAIEGDKAIQEVEAIGSGILRIAPKAPENGDTVKVGTTLAFLVGPDEADTFNTALDSTLDTTAVWPAAAEEALEIEPARSGPAGLPAEQDRSIPAARGRRRASVERESAELVQAASQTGASQTETRRPRVSPRAARVAAELGVDWSTIEGTGRSGRIRERDVRTESARHQRTDRRGRKSVEPVDAPVGSTAQPSFRRTIAARMLEGSQATAPVTLTTTADATNLASLRAQFKATAKSPDELIPGYTDIMVKLAARALQEYPALNRQWIDGQIVAPDGVHIAVAVDTPAGLLAPVVGDVPNLGLREIAARTHDLKIRAHASQLKPQDLTGGTFTISNLGAFGIDAFTPIINVPQCAILGLGRIDRRPTVVGDQIVPRDTITLSLTFDHRIVDGAPAARFLAALRTAIENPGPWLVF
ncbi:MAG TPA: dihydrolipoamide acetyltransferase family protein [Planctomycetaceae bacterium]|jgi:pyruvate dehydrogenase E2 component (dihydrolipoamide acetyltransferase)|nr:dihydrolipoamide acetyltransferase family protein [Planctomycetaceae bacterium]